MTAEGPFEELANTFMTPAKSGVYLAKNELLVLARLSEASLRFNERKRMLADILRSAQSPAHLAEILDRLVAFCRESLEHYTALAETYPAAAPGWQPWIDRARKMVVRLEQTQEELRL